MSLRELGKQFDEEYYMRGLAAGRSLYTNFRWLPSVSFPIANAVKELYPRCSVLDYGCAMGYTVYALRLLNVEAYGYDISEYALQSCKPEVAEYLFSDKQAVPKTDVVFGKDVLEHIPVEFLREELSWLSTVALEACFIVGLGENGKFRIPDYDKDVTHVTKQDEEWWIKQFMEAGYRVASFHHHLKGFKSHWVKENLVGNGIFQLRSKI